MSNVLDFNLDFGIPARLTLSDYNHGMLTIGGVGAVVIIIEGWSVSEWGGISINSGSCGVFPETMQDLEAATRWLTDNVRNHL